MGTKPVSVRLNETERQKVEDFKRRQGCENTSEAYREMVDVAYRETMSPLVYRMKDYVTEAAFYLLLSGVIVVVVSFGSNLLLPVQGAVTATLLWAISLAILGIGELARATNGQSELSELIRGVIR